VKGKSRIVGGGGESKVQLGGAAAKQCGGFERRAGIFNSLAQGPWLAEEAGGVRLGGSWKSGYRRKEAGQLLAKPLPAVALVRHQALEHGDGSFLPAGRGGGDLPEEGWNAREVGDFGEETADFDVGILARLQASEELQNKRFAIKDRGVGLLR
jgi:hypothetical protein